MSIKKIRNIFDKKSLPFEYISREKELYDVRKFLRNLIGYSRDWKLVYSGQTKNPKFDQQQQN